MRRSDSPTLGLDLNEREIRLVHMGVKAGKAYAIKTVVAPLPPGAVAHGVIMEPGTLVVALRRALEELGPTAPARAVVGVSGEQANFRTVSVPPCPDAELPELVAGEVEHQNLLGPGGGPFDFFPLHPVGAPNDVMRSLAVVGVDAQVTLGLCEVLENVGLGVVAFEPTPLSMLRTAVAGLPAGATAFVLVVGPSLTDAAFFVNGRLAAFRRLDVGSLSLVQSFAPSPIFGEADSLYGVPYEAPAMPAEGWSHIDQASVDRLALEAQRTMEYVQRGDRDGAVIERVLVVTDDPEVESLAPMLERRFGLRTEIVRPDVAEAEESRFSAAYGLAIRSLGTGVETPAVDLFTTHRSEAKRVEGKRNFVGSVLVSGVGIAIGLAGCLLYNRQIATVKARSGAVAAQVATVRASTAAILDQRADETMRYKALRKEGVPLGTVMDYVVSGIDPGVGLKFVSVSDDLRVRMNGEARDVTALARTVQALQTSPVLLNVALDHFDRGTKNKDTVLTFEISGATVTADRLKLKETKS